MKDGSAEPAETATHGDIIREVRALAGQVESLRNDVNVGTMAQQKTSNDLVSLAKLVGSTGTDEYGELIGTGLAGEFARFRKRAEERFDWLDTIKKQALIGGAVIAAAAIVVWWLVSPAMQKVFHPAQPPAPAVEVKS